jgi:hypothetical protein
MMNTLITIEINEQGSACRLVPKGDWLPLPVLLGILTYRVRTIKNEYERKREANE